MKSVLLVNLGTPAAPTPAAVRAYLAEFLSDPRVVALPRALWLPILHGIVLRTRPAKSAAKYRQVWMREGSPLAVHSARQAQLLGARLGRPVDYAMRYGAPRLGPAPGRIVVPLYPQFSFSTTESVRDVVGREAAFVEGFHDHPGYLAALEECVRAHWQAHGRGERLVMSFHGLPQRAVERGDPYAVQCRATAALLAGRLGLGAGEWLLTFQSRFGWARWLEPYTEPALVELARQGLRRVDVVCPGFVSDCLETLEEIGIGASEAFRAAGGTELRLIPCLNESPRWIEALEEIVSSVKQ